MPEIHITNQAKAKISIKKLRLAILFILKKIKKNGDISLVITGDKIIKELNRKYRKKNTPTDILSFDGEGDFLGEILIDYQQIKRQAGQFGHTTYEEFIFILIHGILHLAGHDDSSKREREAMVALGEKYFKELIKEKLL